MIAAIWNAARNAAFTLAKELAGIADLRLTHHVHQVHSADRAFVIRPIGPIRLTQPPQ